MAAARDSLPPEKAKKLFIDDFIGPPLFAHSSHADIVYFDECAFPKPDRPYPLTIEERRDFVGKEWI